MKTTATDCPAERSAESTQTKMGLLSFIIPTLDEAGGLQSLYEGIRRQAEKVAEDWEIVFVDRGSGETTCSMIADLARRDPGHVRGDCECGCRSHSDALAAGYRAARGVYVFTVELEQDDDPAEIPGFIARIQSEESAAPSESDSDRWRKILPRGVLRRVRKAQQFLRASPPHLRLQAV